MREEEELCAVRQAVVWPAFVLHAMKRARFLHAQLSLLQTAARSKVEIIDTFKHEPHEAFSMLLAYTRSRNTSFILRRWLSSGL
jgi:hypothetical protein